MTLETQKVCLYYFSVFTLYHSKPHNAKAYGYWLERWASRTREPAEQNSDVTPET